MASKKLSTDTSLANSYKLSRGVASVARPSEPTIGTATDGGSGNMSVTFTASTLGPTASSFTLTSSSGVTASRSSSPLTLQEIVEGTYTYTVSGVNVNGTGPSSAASNSVVVASVDPGSYFPIATTTLATTASSITFSSIPTNYTHLQLRGIVRGGSEAGVIASFNGNGGNGHALFGRGTTSSAGSFQETAGIPIAVTPDSGNNAAAFGTFVVDILDYSNTNKYKTIRSLNGMEITGSGNSYVFFSSGLWQYTSAISSIVLTINGGANFVQYTQFSLYGIKG